MSANKNVYEIFDEFERAKTNEERKSVLLKNGTFALQCILRANYHPDIKFVFEEIPAYNPSTAPNSLGYTSLDSEINRFYLFEQNNPKVPAGMSFKRKTELLQQVLEALEAREALVMEATLLKKLKVKGLTKALALEIFPKLLD